MFEHAAGAQPQVVVRVRLLGGRRVRAEENLGLAGQRFRRRVDDGVKVAARDRLEQLAVELEAGPFLHIGIVVLVVEPAGFLPLALVILNDRPLQAAHVVPVIDIEIRQILAATPELLVFLPQRLLREPAVAEEFGDVVVVALGHRVGPLDLEVVRRGEQHLVQVVVRRVAEFHRLVEHARKLAVGEVLGLQARDLLLAPEFLEREAFGELEYLPQVAARHAGRRHLLAPQLCAALGVAVTTPLLEDHGRRQDQVRDLGRDAGIGLGHDDEVVHLARRLDPVVGVGVRVPRVVRLYPGPLHTAVLEVAQDLGVERADLGIERPGRQLPELLGEGAVLRVRDQPVRRQAVGEGADLARRAAGGGLAGERKCAVAGLRLLAEQQVVHVALLVHPGAALVLVEAHGPVAHDLALGVDVEAGERLELGLELIERLVRVALGQLGHELKRVGLDPLLEILERDLPVAGRVAGALLLDDLALLAALADGLVAVERYLELLRLRVLLRREGVLVGGAHAVADVVRAGGEHAVLAHKVHVHGVALDDLARDVVLDREIGVGLEDNLEIGQLRAHVGVG